MMRAKPPVKRTSVSTGVSAGVIFLVLVAVLVLLAGIGVQSALAAQAPQVSDARDLP